MLSDRMAGEGIQVPDSTSKTFSSAMAAYTSTSSSTHYSNEPNMGAMAHHQFHHHQQQQQQQQSLHHHNDGRMSPRQAPDQIHYQNQQLMNGGPSASSCLVCYTAPVDTVMEPCQHHVHAQCNERWLVKDKVCPVCWSPIQSHRRIATGPPPSYPPPPVPTNSLARAGGVAAAAYASKPMLSEAESPRAANSNSAATPTSANPSAMRKGKWTGEESAYCDRLIEEFKKGNLPLAEGTTLRTFLSKLLNCDPMRISKKYTGDQCIGKIIFRRREDEIAKEEMDAIRKDLAELEKTYLDREQYNQRRREKRLESELSRDKSRFLTSRTLGGYVNGLQQPSTPHQMSPSPYQQQQQQQQPPSVMPVHPQPPPAPKMDSGYSSNSGLHAPPPRAPMPLYQQQQHQHQQQQQQHQHGMQDSSASHHLFNHNSSSLGDKKMGHMMAEASKQQQQQQPSSNSSNSHNSADSDDRNTSKPPIGAPQQQHQHQDSSSGDGFPRVSSIDSFSCLFPRVASIENFQFSNMHGNHAMSFGGNHGSSSNFGDSLHSSQHHGSMEHGDMSKSMSIGDGLNSYFPRIQSLEQLSNLLQEHAPASPKVKDEQRGSLKQPTKEKPSLDLSDDQSSTSSSSSRDNGDADLQRRLSPNSQGPPKPVDLSNQMQIPKPLHKMPRSSSGIFPRVPSMDKLPRVPSMDKLPRIPSMDKLPRVPSMDKLPRVPSMDRMSRVHSNSDIISRLGSSDHHLGSFPSFSNLSGLSSCVSYDKLNTLGNAGGINGGIFRAGGFPRNSSIEDILSLVANSESGSGITGSHLQLSALAAVAGEESAANDRKRRLESSSSTSSGPPRPHDSTLQLPDGKKSKLSV